MNFFEKLSLNLKIVFKYKPFFRKSKRRMALLETIDLPAPSFITELYNIVSDKFPNKYAKEKKTYKAFLIDTKSHNDEVSFITKTIEEWNLVSSNDEIRIIDDSFFERCFNAALLLKKYKRVKREFVRFPKRMKFIKANYSEFRFQAGLLNDYNKILDFSRCGYITIEKKKEILAECEKVISEYGKVKNKIFVLKKHLDIDSLVESHNNSYFLSNLNNQIFNDINGKSLDEEQRKAVLTEEKSVLVIAGAGSGKTLTICGKVEYLLNEKNVNPSNILLLSYSKKSADDLQSKVSKIDDRLKVGTFHKIGLEILNESQDKVSTVEEQYKSIVEDFFRVEMKKRPDILQLVLTYYGLYISNTKHEKEYENRGDLYSDLKKADFKTLKNQLLSFTNDIESRETIKKELVKSFEELAIANWYFINGINYTYEASYEHNLATSEKRQYLPDFKLDDYPIYHEHYGVNKEFKATQYKGEEAAEYVKLMSWKRHIHEINSTDCIETYSYEFADGTIFEKLEKELKDRGVEFHPLTSSQIEDAMNSIYECRQFKSFIVLIRTFLSLYKASYSTDEGFDELKKKPCRNNYEKQRASIFLDIVKEVYRYYMNRLRGENKIDFDDMILKSIKELDSINTYKYRYIIVDEFQDISFSRMKFLNRLIKQGNSKLFAVGDDWQAIYRFSGCDLSIFLEFPKYFGDSALAKITTTHRNSQELQDIAGPFIRKNPEQINKQINSSKHLDKPVQIIYYSQKKYNAFYKALDEISKTNPKASVLILGRNNKDIEDIDLDSRIHVNHALSDDVKKVVECSEYPNLKLRYSTVHGSKGLEDDYVILINANDGIVGFPNKIEDDELLDLVLSNKSEFEYAEERRLWYVALTRTKNRVYILADIENPSIFLEEIKDKCVVLKTDEAFEERTEISCPWCKSGRLVIRQNGTTGDEFCGCSNYPYCKYSIDGVDDALRNIRCPRCGDIMVIKRGKHGLFFGCHSYPKCKYTEQYAE